MITTLKVQFFNLLGTAESVYLDISEDDINDLLEHGLKDFIAHVTQLNPSMLDIMATEQEIEAQAYDVSGIVRSSILGATKDYENVAEDIVNVPVREVPTRLGGVLQDPTSTLYAIHADPGMFYKGDVLYIYPVPTASESAYLYYVKYGQIDCATDLTVADHTDSKFPEEITSIILLYAVIQAKIKEFGVIRKRGWDDITNIMGTEIISVTACSAVSSKVITHGLGYPPSYRVLDSSGNEVFPEVDDNAPTLTTITFTFVPVFTGNIYLYNTITSGGLLESYINAIPTWSAPTPPTITAFTPSLSLSSVPAISAFSGTSVPTFNISASLPTAPDITGGGGDVVITTLPVDLNLDRMKNALNQAAGFIYKYWDDGTSAAKDDLIAVDVYDYIADHDTEVARLGIDAANALSRVGETEVNAQIKKTEQWVSEVKMLMQKYEIQVRAAQVDVEADAANIRSEATTYAASIGAEADGYVGEHSNNARNFAALVSSEAQQISAEATAYSAQYKALTDKYLGEIQAEFQRNTIAIQTAQLHLNAIEQTLNSVRIIFALQEIKISENNVLMQDYMRRIYAWCRVPMQQQERK